jgi:antitoxin (DNA-binding transcriptional repressor) of toxin-antitoxin stability system
VESTGEALIITDKGEPVLKIIPYTRDPTEALRALRGSVIRYTDPLEPVGLEGWESGSCQLAGLLSELEQEHGPIEPEVMEEVRRRF